MSDHHNSHVQLAAAQEAKQRFKRACHDMRKVVRQQNQLKGPAPSRDHAEVEHTISALPIREKHLTV
jgi:hypothetical protein